MSIMESTLDTLPKTQTYLSLNKNTPSKTTWQQIKNKRHRYYLVTFCRQILLYSTKRIIYKRAELTNLNIRSRHLRARVAFKDPTLVRLQISTPITQLFPSQLQQSIEDRQEEGKGTIAAQREAIQHITLKRLSLMNRRWGPTRRWAKTQDITCDIPHQVNRGQKVAHLEEVQQIWMHPTIQVLMLHQHKWLKDPLLLLNKQLKIGPSFAIVKTSWLPWQII